MELKRTELKVNIYGQDCVLRFPVMREFREFSRKAEAAKDDDVKALDMTKEFLCSLGMKADIFEELEPDHMKQILDAVTVKQKKS